MFKWLIVRCSSEFGASIMQDRDLSMYRPAASRTSKHLPCSHELCSSVSTSCESPKQPCPYFVDYYSENTSSSGLLVEDTLYLASSDADAFIHASVIIGYIQPLLLNIYLPISNVLHISCSLKGSLSPGDDRFFFFFFASACVGQVWK